MLLRQQGFEQYEISAWARPGRRCAHNLNYWRYGDYLGIGAGAHGKITLPAEQRIRRYSKHRHPKTYLQATINGIWCAEATQVKKRDRAFEFFLNQLRLRDGVRLGDFTPRTGLDLESVKSPLAEAQKRGLLQQYGQALQPTELGWRFVNETQALFLPEN